MNKGELADLVIRRGCLESKENLMKRLKAELYALAKEDCYQGRLAVEVEAEKSGYEILWLPPYHPELNPIEEAWGLTKQHVALENDGSDFGKVRDLILSGFDKCNETWPKLVRRTKENEKKYERLIIAQRTVDALPPLVIDISDSEEDEEDSDDDLIDLGELDDGLVPLEIA